MLTPLPLKAALTAFALAAFTGGVALFTGGVALAAGAGPTVATNRGCYLVGQPVRLSGSGFAAARSYIVTIDGVYFGQSTTSAAGAFTATLRPGGLQAGEIQHVEHLEAADGSIRASTHFTLSRNTGARIVASGGNPHTLRAPFQIWGFALDGANRTVYLHYVAPSGLVRKTVALGRTSGQCGYIQTSKLRVFPFSAQKGQWTLQVDSRRSYSRRPHGPVAKILVRIS